MVDTRPAGTGLAMACAKTGLAATLAAAVVVHAAQAQNRSPNNPLVGTWTLASLVNKDASGNQTHPWGAKPVGIFMFDPAGHFSEIIINEEKPNTSLDYFGAYSVEGNTLRLLRPAVPRQGPPAADRAERGSTVLQQHQSLGRRHRNSHLATGEVE